MPTSCPVALRHALLAGRPITLNTRQRIAGTSYELKTSMTRRAMVVSGPQVQGLAASTSTPICRDLASEGRTCEGLCIQPISRVACCALVVRGSQLLLPAAGTSIANANLAGDRNAFLAFRQDIAWWTLLLLLLVGSAIQRRTLLRSCPLKGIHILVTGQQARVKNGDDGFVLRCERHPAGSPRSAMGCLHCIV